MYKTSGISAVYCFYASHCYDDQYFYESYIEAYDKLRGDVIAPGSKLWIEIVCMMHNKWLLGIEYIELDDHFPIAWIDRDRPGQFSLMWCFRILLFSKLFTIFHVDCGTEYYDFSVNTTLIYNGVIEIMDYVVNRPKRVCMGLFRCISKLHVLRQRAAERVYSPGGSGYLRAQTSFYSNIPPTQ